MNEKSLFKTADKLERKLAAANYNEADDSGRNVPAKSAGGDPVERLGQHWRVVDPNFRWRARFFHRQEDGNSSNEGPE